MKKPKLTFGQLAHLLWTAGDDLRGNIDASAYKEYIFGMRFLNWMNWICMAAAILAPRI